MIFPNRIILINKFVPFLSFIANEVEQTDDFKFTEMEFRVIVKSYFYKTQAFKLTKREKIINFKA